MDNKFKCRTQNVLHTLWFFDIYTRSLKFYNINEHAVYTPDRHVTVVHNVIATCDKMHCERKNKQIDIEAYKDGNCS